MGLNMLHLQLIVLFCVTNQNVLSMVIEPNPKGDYHVENIDYTPEPTLSFSILGDWGGFPKPWHNTPIQTSAAKLLGEVSEQRASRFNLAIGDNFYFWGVKDVYDERWYTTFERIYVQKSLQQPWYVLAGNHDWQGNVTAQFDYSKLSKRWTFPYYYYSMRYTFDQNITLKIIMIDTQLHCDAGEDPSHDGGHSHHYPVKPPLELKENQLEWFEQELKDSENDDYVLVVGHYQIHTPGGTLGNMKDIDAMIKKYNVNAYISGHIHDSEHLVATDGSAMDYIVTGISSLTNVEDKEIKNTNVDVKFYHRKFIDFK